MAGRDDDDAVFLRSDRPLRRRFLSHPTRREDPTIVYGRNDRRIKSELGEKHQRNQKTNLSKHIPSVSANAWRDCVLEEGALLI